ncbi:MAG: iron ABC transporter permease [Armatimonadetes bacterium]|nr:iron ABC transporter permease [Armatimonadota bacterium]
MQGDRRLASVGQWLAFAVVTVVLLLFLVIPMFSLFWVSFTGEPSNILRDLFRGDLAGFVRNLTEGASLHYYREFFTTPRYYMGLINGLLFSAMVTLGCCVLGVGLALAMARTAVPFKGVLRALSVLPLAIPSYLMALSFILIFGKTGLITRGLALVGIPQIDPFTPFACAMVQIFSFFPLVLLTTSAALERMDPSLEEASSVLGGPRDYTFSRVSIPMLLPGVAAGAFLTFIRSFGDFATMKLLIPSSTRMIVVEAYRDMSGNTYWGGAATLSTVMVAVILIGLGLQKYVIERNRFETLTGKGIAQPRLMQNPAACWAIFAVCVILLGFPVLNLGIIALLSVASNWTTTALPSSYTLANYQRALFDKPESIVNGFILSGIALVLALAFAGGVAYMIHRTKFWGRHVLDFVTLFPFIIPGTAFAIALVTTFNEPPLALHLTVYIVVIAYVITRTPYGVRSILASFQQIGPAMEESSKTLGATGTVTLWKVLLPLIRPGIIAGGIMIFISTMTDVAITIMVCPPAWYPASLHVFNQVADSHYSSAAAYGIVLMALIYIPYIIMLKIVGVRDMSL